MPLTDTQIRNARFNPDGTGNRLTDGGRMYLQIVQSGAKYWRMNYRFNGKDKTLALGVYPDVSLAAARRKRDEARERLASGIDPGESKKAEKRTQRLNAENSFEAIAREWHAKYAPTWSEGHGERILRRLEVDAFPWIGGKPIADLAPPDVLDVLRRVEKRGALETAHRLHANIGQACRYAVATGRAQRDITADLRGALPPVQVEHMAAITDPKQVAELLRAIDGYQGTLPVLCALRLAPLLFQRPGELRAAEWTEFNLDAATWEIPSDRMKRTKQGKAAGGAHIVPLSNQAIAILRELHALTGSGRFVFPSVRTKERPMSDNTVNGALRRLGYDGDTMTGHGFRAMARTILDEVMGVPAAIVEAQLAHAVKDPLGRAYNRTAHLPQRREMMQRWADYLDRLKAGAQIIPITAAGGST
ncbi:TPA: integrase arm-type DNA-binding domain-containing protein [Burkholderia vietnamiensis]|uniref:tyrosine-type recombinase/integrase n=1 Tax=Burkholderia vietnamiensis TaxID=60552 RepID=UPI00075657F9|nr:integrase arm-type DNA-binding domain-containing protein [Burkholderia vietnamiensis]KVR72972.1 integrase [Burkholderia vietnamiensis]MCA8207195.1 integrase arm-type DNA-binding domain-containing protein [Burkholderia vietnamiensis]HDR9097065.1 integrase arm-type DNA-binding domain-containing protein [Burkholderia vietnamiensis]HDR9118847.1 integrase arm-type DNA-binding domain-containing protein [Burkholderia vietnamiensis]HDR9123257.1 integrase arm-type DNA-binding domain-containing prote